MTNWQEETSKARTDLAAAQEKIAGHEAEKAYKQGIIDGKEKVIEAKSNVIVAQNRQITALNEAIESMDDTIKVLNKSRAAWKLSATANMIAVFVLIALCAMHLIGIF